MNPLAALQGISFGPQGSYQDLLSQEQLKAAKQQGLLGFGSAMLANSGWSTQRPSLGAALGQGVMAGSQMQQQAQQQALQTQMLKRQMNAEDYAQKYDLVPIVGEDGVPKYVSRSEALGREPFNNASLAKDPASIREYNLAREQGYKGSFQDWLKERNQRFGVVEYGGKKYWVDNTGFTPPQLLSTVEEEAEAAATVAGATAGATIPAQGAEAVDRAYAPEYIAFVNGGASNAAKSIEALKTAQAALGGSNSLTGPIVGAFPKGVRDFTNPDSAAIQERVEGEIQRSLREILGAQFTEKEGERLLARAYNPRLSEQENALRLGWLVDQLERAYEEKIRAAQYWEANNTLKGFEGRTQWNVDDFDYERNTGGGWREVDGVRVRERSQ